MNSLVMLSAISSNVTMLIVLAVLMVVMLVMSIVPQRKRQKETQKMMESLKVGTKIKTIGGFIGEIVSMDSTTNTLVIDLSDKGDRSLCATIDRSAVYTVMSVNAQGQTVEPQKETALDDVKPAATEKVEETKEDAKVEENKEEAKETVETTENKD